MESSKVTIVGDSEECSSSESGWTMYLASPMHDNDDDSHGDGDVEDEDEEEEDDDDKRNKLDDDDDDDDDDDNGDDDDSMASDASSGPAQEKYNNKLEMENGCKKNQNLEARKDEKNESKGSKKEAGDTSFHGKSKDMNGKY